MPILVLPVSRWPILSPPEGRGQRTTVTTRDGTFLVIDESYNANPASMRAAIELLGATLVARTGRRIAVLGDMLEMGDESPAFHKDLAPIIDAASVDLLFCCGPNMKALADCAVTRRAGRMDRQTRRS